MANREGPTKEALVVAYFLRIPNVGDRVVSAIVEALTSRQAVWTCDLQAPHLLAAGSVLAQATSASLVWGSGVMHRDLDVGSAAPTNIRALRGPLSWEALRAAGIDTPDVPFGDPGFLAPGLLGFSRQPASSKLGVVAHYTDRAHPEIARILKSHDVIDLNVHTDPLTFLRAMSECSAVVSSSLHGLVFAEAMGIPNLWIKCGDEIGGGDFKFNDWFATMAQPQSAPRRLEAGDTVEGLASIASLHESQIDRDALAASFPLAETASTTPRAHSAATCRARPTPVFLISFDRAGMLR